MELNLNLGSGIVAVNPTPSIVFSQVNPGREVIKIKHTGEVYWKGKLVETDADFKLAMLDLLEHFKGHR